MNDKIIYINAVQRKTESLFGEYKNSKDNHGNKAKGPTIVCADGSVIERTKAEFRSDVRAIDTGEGEGIFANPFNGYSIDLGNLPSPLQTRCEAVAEDQLGELAASVMPNGPASCKEMIKN